MLQLFFHYSACLVVTTIYDPFTCKFPRCNGRCSASVAYPFPYNGIRDVLRSFWSGSFVAQLWLDQSGLKRGGRWLWHVTECPYRLESPSGLVACTVSGLSQRAEVMCSNLLMKIETLWWLRFGLIWSIRWDFHWDFIYVIYEIPCSVPGAALKLTVAIYYSGLVVSLR
jgi:hypothetical protein